MAEFDRDAETMLARQQARADAFAAEVAAFVEPAGDERALDVGTGTGALAFALAPVVREVVGVDTATALLDRARREAPANASFVEGDATALPFDRGSFDLAGTVRVLHHVARPQLVLAEMARVTRPGGTILVVDQLGDTDTLRSLEIDRFERTRDPSHTRLLPDGDLRAIFEMNGLVLLRDRHRTEARELGAYLDYAGCSGDERERAHALAPSDPYHVEIGWYLLRRP